MASVRIVRCLWNSGHYDVQQQLQEHLYQNDVRVEVKSIGVGTHNEPPINHVYENMGLYEEVSII